MAEWAAWAVLEGDRLVYVLHSRHSELMEFSARQEAQIRASHGHKVRLAQVKIVEQNPSDQPS